MLLLELFISNTLLFKFYIILLNKAITVKYNQDKNNSFY